MNQKLRSLDKMNGYQKLLTQEKQPKLFAKRLVYLKFLHLCIRK